MAKLTDTQSFIVDDDKRTITVIVNKMTEQDWAFVDRIQDKGYTLIPKVEKTHKPRKPRKPTVRDSRDNTDWYLSQLNDEQKKEFDIILRGKGAGKGNFAAVSYARNKILSTVMEKLNDNDKIECANISGNKKPRVINKVTGEKEKHGFFDSYDFAISKLADEKPKTTKAAAAK